MDIVPEASPLTKMKTNDEIEMEGLMGGFTEVNLDAILSQDNLINALEPTVSSKNSQFRSKNQQRFGFFKPKYTHLVTLHHFFLFLEHHGNGTRTNR